MSADTKRDSGGFLKKPDKPGSKLVHEAGSKSLRIELELFEPDEHNSPEFNYKKLVHIAKKKQKKISKLTNGSHSESPFGGGDEADVERIAREMEEKYANSYTKPSRLTNVDRGGGYDHSDSFIDDTEAYDELIPDEIETDRGGFYINSGSLEFKKLANFERPGDEIRMPKAKKRALSSSSDSSRSADVDEEKVAEKLKKKKVHTEKKAKESSSDEQGKAKKVKKQEKPKEIPKEPLQEPKTVDKEPEKVVKTTTVKDMLRAKRDHMRKMEQGKPSTTDNDEDDGGSGSVSSAVVSESSRDSHDPAQANDTASTDITIPENLPKEIAALISSLKQHAENAASTKSNFFDSSVLDQLVTIDNGAKSVNATVRVQTFNYLEQFTPCTKKTLFGKVRKHRITQIEQKTKLEVNKLRKIVDESMPTLVEKYSQEVLQMQAIKKIEDVIGDSPRTVVTPRKKFHWNDHSRTALCNVIQCLKDLFKTMKVRKEKEEMFLAEKLTEIAVPLWPEGWIQLEDFHREMERKKKKEARASSNTTSQAQPAPSNQPKPSAAVSVITTNGRASDVLMTDLKTESENSVANGKNLSQKPLPQPISATSPSVIKRSSDHSINSIISSSPSPPTTSQQIKPQGGLLEVDTFASVSDIVKAAQRPSMPAFLRSPIDKELVSEKVRRSNSSDSDCVEIIQSDPGDFSPIKPSKSLYLPPNNNKLSPIPHIAPIAKKSKLDNEESSDTNDYSRLIAGIQSLTDPKKSNQYQQNQLSSVHNPLPRKSETPSQVFCDASKEKVVRNGTSSDLVDVQTPGKVFNHHNNVHYTLNDFISNRTSGSISKGKTKSYDHQVYRQQPANVENNKVHSVSLTLSPPPLLLAEARTANYVLPSVLNLSNKK